MANEAPNAGHIVTPLYPDAARKDSLSLRTRLLSLSPGVWWQGTVLYLVCFIILAAIIFAPQGFLGTDDYYHARISDQIIEQGRLRLDFPWLPKTILNDEAFTDHHLLFHLYVAPWVHFGDIQGAKIATASIAAGIFVAVWVLLRGIGVRYAMGWSLAMFGLSVPFLYRILMVRTQGASLLMLVLALHMLFQKRYRWLILLGFGYVWLYNGFVLMLGFAMIYTVSLWVIERQFAWQPVFYCGLGLAMGLIINPYFPQNLLFIYDHLIAKVNIDASGVQVGNEWYAYTTSVLLENSLGALVALGLAIIHPFFSSRKRDVADMTLLFAAFLTLYMLFKSRRFIEYYPAFALLAAAAAWGRGDIPLHHWLPEWGSYWQRLAFHKRLSYDMAGRILVAAGVLVLVIYFVRSTVLATYHDAQNAVDVKTFEGASTWLKTYTPPDSAVFQTDWDDFTRLFYYNTHNTYLVGLDPTYLQRENPALWDKWVAVTRGQVGNLAETIRNDFGAEYVVSDRQHGAFEARAKDDPAMRLVYQDQYSIVWRILSDSGG